MSSGSGTKIYDIRLLRSGILYGQEFAAFGVVGPVGETGFLGGVLHVGVIGEKGVAGFRKASGVKHGGRLLSGIWV